MQTSPISRRLGEGEGGGGLEKTHPVFQWSGGSCLCIIVLISSLKAGIFYFVTKVAAI